MRNKLKQQLITYFLSLTFILTMGNSFDTRHKPYIVAAPEPFVKAGFDFIITDYKKLTYLQPTIKLKPIENSENKKVVSQKFVQAIQTAVSRELSILERSLSEYEVTSHHLNIRTKANATSKILSVINKGDLIEVLNAAKNGWLALKQGGYVNGKYTKLKTPANANKTKKIAQVTTLSLKSAVVTEIAKPTSNVKSDSGLREANIEEILKGTSLAGHDLEKAILEIEAEFGINAYFTIAVMKLESGNGKSRIAKDKNNLFGLNAIDGDVYNKAFSFKTKGDSVRKFGQLISKNYLDKGYTTIEKVSTKYCQANPKWSGVVKGIMKSDYNKL
jgi:flagellum-specific peptidoglycan hydrolase FlgJ